MDSWRRRSQNALVRCLRHARHIRIPSDAQASDGVACLAARLVRPVLQHRAAGGRQCGGLNRQTLSLFLPSRSVRPNEYDVVTSLERPHNRTEINMQVKQTTGKQSTMSAETHLGIALAAHRAWVLPDGQAGTQLDLSDADLASANFAGANFKKAYLTKANLQNADLAGADAELDAAYVANGTAPSRRKAKVTL